MGRANKQKHGPPQPQGGKGSNPGADPTLTKQAATSWKRHSAQKEK